MWDIEDSRSYHEDIALAFREQDDAERAAATDDLWAEPTFADTLMPAAPAGYTPLSSLNEGDVFTLYGVPARVIVREGDCGWISEADSDEVYALTLDDLMSVRVTQRAASVAAAWVRDAISKRAWRACIGE